MRDRLAPLALAASLFLGPAALAPAPAAAAVDGSDAPAGPAAAVAHRSTAGQDTVDEAEDENGDGLPLDPARRLQFTTSEGSWISVDVAPSGDSLVFDLMGDLYLLPIEGGRARRLTEGMGFDSQPRFSPDGDRIAFVSDRSGGENVWIVSRDGTDTTRVTKGDQNQFHSPEWTPDGDYVVVSGAEGFGPPPKLEMYHVEGGSGVQLVDEPEELRMSGAAFGPDGRRIWYAARQGLWEYNAGLPQYQLQVYDRETGERYTRTSRYGSAFRPTVSPDGRWLVYGTRHDAETGLRLRDLDTGDERWLAYPVQHDDQESTATMDVYPGMSFTPDSEALIATWDGKLWRVPLEAGAEPAEIPFTAEVDLGLGPELDFDYAIPDTGTFTARQIRDAAPSPDGSRIAFTVLDQLYVMDWPDGEPRALFDHEDVVAAQPAWSPDGRWIAFATWEGAETGGNLYKARADGSGDPVLLTAEGAVWQQPAWSPDGERIVALRGPARAYRATDGPFAPSAAEDIVWVPAGPEAGGGSEERTVAPTEGREHPHFRPDEPGRIYLTRGDGTLVSIRWDGTDSKEHLKVTGYRAPLSEQPLTAAQIRIAPDGGHALAEVGWQLYDVTVPYVGGETPTVSVTSPDAAPVPVTQLSEVGGEFPRWGADGTKAHWSLGAHHFVYDLDRAGAVRDSLERAEKEEKKKEEREDADGEGEDAGEAGGAVTARADGQEADEEEDAGYEPVEREVAVPVERDVPEGTLALVGARLITMDGDEVIEDGTIVVEDNRIAAVGPSDEVTVPAGAETRDVAGRTIVPGFVDTHGHPWPAWGIHKTQVAKYLANLAYGVTTTRDPQTSTTDVLTYADRVRAGRMTGPRIYSTGPGIFSSTDIEDLEHARDVVSKYSDYFDTKTIKQYLAGNREQRQWLIMAAKEERLMPTTEGALDMKLDLTQIVDGYPGHEHSLPIFPLYRDVDRLMAFTDVTYTPTLLVAYGGPWAENYFYSRHNPHDSEKLQRFTPHQVLDDKVRRRGAGWFMDEEHVFEEHARELNQMVDAGGEAGIGSHGQLDGLGYHWELWAVASGGMSNHRALRVATLHGARGIGLEREIGSLEEGKLADLLVLEENPLADLRATNTLTHVMKNGRLYDADTLDEVWPRERELEGLYWRGQGPGEE